MKKSLYWRLNDFLIFRYKTEVVKIFSNAFNLHIAMQIWFMLLFIFIYPAYALLLFMCKWLV